MLVVSLQSIPYLYDMEDLKNKIEELFEEFDDSNIDKKQLLESILMFVNYEIKKLNR